jgi:putative transposase
MTTPARARYTGYRPAGIITHAIWLYFRFPPGLRMMEELLAARGIIVSHETVRQWALKFGQPLTVPIAVHCEPMHVSAGEFCARTSR